MRDCAGKVEKRMSGLKKTIEKIATEGTFLTKNCLKLICLIGFIQVAAYYMAGSLATDSQSFPVAQPDTLLYCQSAKQIARGYFFIFSPGEQVSTGSTTHLYPFVLALPYLLGAKGDMLVTAGFLMNAGFYLVFLVSWALIACRMVSSGKERIIACILLALNGQSAYTSMSQSDMGFFMMVSSVVFAALLYERWWWFGLSLLVIPWCRPEGVPMAFLFLTALGVKRVGFKEQVSFKLFGIAIVGVVSAIGVFVFNKWLTGDFQFQSVSNKGYFNSYGQATAVFKSGRDLLLMFQEMMLGLPRTSPREMFFLPLFGSVIAWIGIVVRPWRKETAWKELWWICCSLISFFVVATSGWQNTNVDRYLGWVLPIWFIFIAQGLAYFSRELKSKVGRILPLTVVIIFHVASSLMFVFLFNTNSLMMQMLYESEKELVTKTPSDASVGGYGNMNYLYIYGVVHGDSELNFINLSGIFAPRFLTKDLVCNIERIKHDQGNRFDYWLFPDADVSLCGFDVEELCPVVTATAMSFCQMRKTDWTLLDRALEARSLLNGWRKVDSLDVGFPEDEQRCQYSEYSRIFGLRLAPFGSPYGTETNRLYEVGRAIIGYDSMTISAEKGYSLSIIMRTTPKASTPSTLGSTTTVRDIELNSPLKVRVDVDGIEVGTYELLVEVEAGDYTECKIIIPAEFITSDKPRITLYGDHIPLAYWFYQETESDDSRFGNKLESQDNTAVAK